MRRLDKLLLVVYLCVGLRGQSINDCGVQYSYGYIRVVCDMTSNPPNPTLEWEAGGTQPPYDNSATMEEDNTQTRFTQSLVRMGLDPATLYNIRVCTNGAGGGTCTANIQATTLRLPRPWPQVAVEPNIYNPTRPVINGNQGPAGGGTWTADTCAELDTILTSNAPNGILNIGDALNYEIVANVSLECYRHLEWPNRPTHTGWVVVRSSAAGTTAFPPDGVRLTNDWPVDNIVPVFKGLSWGSWSRYLATTLPTPCGLSGRLASVNVGVSDYREFPIERCNESAPAYAGADTVGGWAGAGPVTVTINGHSIVSGNPVTFPVNDCVNNSTYLAYNITANTFDIDTTTIGGCLSTPTVTVATQWSNPPYSQAAGSPSLPCPEESWYWDTTVVTWNDSLYWCAGGVWTPRQETTDPTNGTRSAAWEIQGDKYWFWGIKIDTQPTPQEFSGFPMNWDQGATLSNQGALVEQIHVGSGAEDIVGDQMFLNGRAFPTRATKGIQLSGTGPYMFANSSLLGFSWWTTSQQANAGAQAINWGQGSRLSVINTDVESIGIGFFSTGQTDYDNPFPMDDAYFYRNHFRLDPDWRYLGGAPVRVRPRRHHGEDKHGKRWWWRGNRLDYSWRSINAAAFLTPFHQNNPPQLPAGYTISGFVNEQITVATSACMNVGDAVVVDGTGDADYDDLVFFVSDVTSCTVFDILDMDGNAPVGAGAAGTVWLRAQSALVTDWKVTNNVFWRGSELTRNDGDQSNTNESLPIERVEWENNAAVDLNADSFAAGGWTDENGFNAAFGDFGARIARIARQIQSFRFRHNTVYGERGANPCFLCGDEAMAGLDASFNLLTHNEAVVADFVRFDGNNGTAGLNFAYPAGWSAEENTICCNKAAAGFPGDWLFPATEAAVGWYNPSLGADFNLKLLPSSSFNSGGANRARDGKQMGVDMLHVDIEQGEVEHVRTRRVGANSAIVSYLAPDEFACTVEYETGGSGAWGEQGDEVDFGRVGDGGGTNRVRNVTLPGLVAASDYLFRVFCAVEQPTGSFETR